MHLEKIDCNDESIRLLKDHITRNKECSEGNELRNKNKIQSKIKLNYHYSEATFDFFFVNFFNNFVIK